VEELAYLIAVLKRTLEIDFNLIDDIISNYYVSRAHPDPEGGYL